MTSGIRFWGLSMSLAKALYGRNEIREKLEELGLKAVLIVVDETDMAYVYTQMGPGAAIDAINTMKREVEKTL